MNDWTQFAKKHYFNFNSAAAFAGPKKLKTVLKQNGYNVSLNEVQKWLQDQDAYSLMKPAIYRFKRQRVVSAGIDYLWDGDLADVSNIKSVNDGYSFLLILIDVFSRFLWIEPIKTKSQNDMKSGFERIFSRTTRQPRKLRTDNGKEFTSRAIKQYLKSRNIKAFTTRNETKANYAERAIRTVKSLLYRYFLHKQTHRYVDVLQDLVFTYNNRPHKSLESQAPASVTSSNEDMIWKTMYVDKNSKRKKSGFRFKINDQVRISYKKYVFQRDYHQKWTEEYFIITQRVRKANHNMYKLKDLTGEDIDGLFYESELQKINKTINSTFRVQKILKRRRKKSGEELFIKWMGWPDKFNSWVAAVDVQKY